MKTIDSMLSALQHQHQSVRFRLLAASVSLFVVAIFGALLLQRSALLEQLDDEVADSLEQEAEEVRRLATGNDPTTAQPFDGNVARIFETFLERNLPEEGETFITLINGLPYRATAAPVALDQEPVLLERWANLTTAGERASFDSRAGEVRYLALPIRVDGATQGVFVVANFVDAERAEIESVTRTGVAVALLTSLAVSTVLWVIAGRILAPVRLVSETAQEISESDLSRRIPVRGNDQVAQMAQLFNSMLDRLQSAFASQRQFIDDAGHELRTPITIVRGQLETMGDDPADRHETLAIVTDELDRMSRFVEDLLLLAKAGHPDFLRFEVVDLQVFVEQTLAKMRVLGDWNWSIDNNARVFVVADRQRLTQAVMNLAQNAARHTQPGRAIAIGASVQTSMARIWIRDEGEGIGDDDKSRIFERFARGSTHSREPDGAGLGLAIVAAIVDAHGGSVEVDSVVGRGSTFTLVLPVEQEVAE